MARLDEIAEGIAVVLVSSPEPEPLNVSLRGEGITNTTFFVRAVVDSCERQGSPIKEVRVCIDLGSDLLKLYGRDLPGYQGVKIAGSLDLSSEVQFYRYNPAA